MSKKFRREVTEFGLASILELIREENDSECRSLALDSILILIGADDDQDIPCPVARDTALHISQSKDLISLFFNVLDDGEVKAKLSALRLLTAVARNYPVEVQNVIQEKPGGSSMLVDGIGSANELLRNECLLLLIAVAENNQILQKIIAFENTFEIALNVAGAEGGIDGGPVSEDCFALLLTLLKDNQSNISFFRETALIPRLIPFLDAVSSGDENWTAGKINCCLLFLGIIRSLVSTTLPGSISLPNQKSMRKTGLFAKLMNFIMGVSVPEEILIEVILTVSECARKYSEAQSDLAALVAPSPNNLPALVVLLRSMVNSKQPLSLRLAVLYCTCSLMVKNPQCQKATIDSLLPSESPSSFTAGVIISGGLFKADPLTCWLSAAAMAEAVYENPEQQAALSRVQLSNQSGTSTLSSFLTGSLAHSQSPHARLGILQLVAVWCAGCPEAAKRFIEEGNLVSTLQLMLEGSPSDSVMLLNQGVAALVMGLLAINDDSDQVVTSLRKRPGPDQFLDALAGVAKSQSYASAAGNACPSANEPEDLLIFNSFTRIYRQYEAKVGRYVVNFEEIQAEMAVKRANEDKIRLLESQLAQIEQNSVAVKDAEAMLKQITLDNEQLKQDLATRPKIELPEGLSEDEIRQKLSEELRPEVENDVRACLAKELSDGVKEELRESLSSEIRKELEETVLEALEDELRIKVEEELGGPEAAKKDARLAELEQDLNESTEQASSLLEQLNIMTAQFTAQKKELDELSAKHATLEKSTSNVAQHHENQLLQLQKLLQTATTEIQARDAKIQELMASPNAVNNQELARLNQEMNKLETSAKIAIGDKQALINRLEAKLAQIESAGPSSQELPLPSSAVALTDETDSLKKRIGELETAAKEDEELRQGLIKKLESENLQLNSRNSESFERISSFEALLSDKEREARTEIESRDTEIERLSSLVNSLESVPAEKINDDDNSEMEMLLEKLSMLEASSKRDQEDSMARIETVENDRKKQVTHLLKLLECSEVERENLESRMSELEASANDNNDLEALKKENSDMKAKIEDIEKELGSVKSQAKPNEAVKTGALSSSEIEEELEELKKDQEDLLELLSDQQLKISDYRTRLKEANQPVTDDEDIELQ